MPGVYRAHSGMRGRSAVSCLARVDPAGFAVGNAGAAPPGGLIEELPVQLGGECMDRASQFRADPISDPQLKVCGPLCPVRHDEGVLLAALRLRGVHAISQLDHLTRTVKFHPPQRHQRLPSQHNLGTGRGQRAVPGRHRTARS